jgi:hypothetical protein
LSRTFTWSMLPRPLCSATSARWCSSDIARTLASGSGSSMSRVRGFLPGLRELGEDFRDIFIMCEVVA